MNTFLIIVIPSLLAYVQGRLRWHTSQTSLMRLYDLQKEHFNVFNDYLDKETERLGEIKKQVADIYKWRDEKITENKGDLHVNSFKMMTRIHDDLRKIERLMCNNRSIEALKPIDEHKDLSGDHVYLASQGLRRIQIFYEIPASEMAAGRFNVRIIGDQLNAYECYVLAKYCFEENDMYGSLDWGIQAYNNWAIGGGQSKYFDIKQLKYYIMISSGYIGFNYRKRFDSDETHNYHSDNIEKFSRYSLLMRNEINNVTESGGDIASVEIFDSYRSFDNFHNKLDFQRLCKRRETTWTLTKNSKCRYQAKNCPYRLLMPFKEEDIYNDPLIKIYHDVLYDNEIEKMKKLVTDKMNDTKVLYRTGSLLIEKQRSGQTGRIFNDVAASQFYSLNSRIESFTGLSTKYAEPYQIVNYGLGGHYLPHSDSFAKGLIALPHGNRIMSTVQNDGFTVFPTLNIVSPAEKGAALVWYNLHHLTDGRTHKDNLHGSCPILKGNKWIVTRWLYEDGQNLPYNWKDNI